MMTLEKFEQFENKSNDLFLSPESFVFIQGFSTKKLSRQELQDLRNQELNGEKVHLQKKMKKKRMNARHSFNEYLN